MSKKIFKGKVVSDKMEKTVVVSVEVPKKHPIYGKDIKNTKKFKARNLADAALNDIVTIQESKPYSKTVKWEVLDVVEKAAVDNAKVKSSKSTAKTTKKGK